ncbi:serine/threonine-protein kinase [Streptomyces sp. NPDC008238]
MATAPGETVRRGGRTLDGGAAGGEGPEPDGAVRAARQAGRWADRQGAPGPIAGGEAAVAVRVVNREFAADEAFRSRFAEGAAGLRGVTDATFTAVMVDVDAEAERPWLASVFVAGLSLAEAVAEYGVLPPESVAALGVGLVRALQVLHAAGVVHGGLKPSTVMMTTDGPRLVDAGLVPAAEASALAERGVLVESPEFMAPEQLFGNRSQAASDVFRLGAVLVFAATGDPVFGEGSRHELARRVEDEEPDLEGLVPPLREIAAGCLAVEPADRPPLTDLLVPLAAVAGPAPAAADDAGRGGPPVTDWLPAQLAAAVRAHQQAAIAPQHPMVSRRHLITGALAWTAIGTVAAGAGTVAYKILRPSRVEANWYGGVQRALMMNLPASVRDGTLIGPHFSLRVRGIALTEELSELGAAALRLYKARHAAEGQEFVVVTFAEVEDATPWRRGLTETSQKKVSLTVETGGRARLVSTYPSGLDNETVGPATLALSVPKGAPVTLRVTDEGRTPSMDRRTGERGGDAVAAYYRPLPKLRVTAEDYEAIAQVSLVNSRLVRMGVRFAETEAYVGPWVRPGGWARPGRWWLMLRWAEVYTGFATTEQLRNEYDRSRMSLSGQVHYGKSFTLHSGGKTYQPRGADTIDWTESEVPSLYSHSVVFDVPEGWHEGGTLVFRPKVSLSTGLLNPEMGEFVAGPVTWDRGFPEHRIMLTPTGQ